MTILFAIVAYAVIGTCIAALYTKYSDNYWAEDDAIIVGAIWPLYLAYLPFKKLYYLLLG